MNKDQGVIKNIFTRFHFMVLPIAVLLLLFLVNIIADVIRAEASALDFFIIQLRTNNLGNRVLFGPLTNILNGAS